MFLRAKLGAFHGYLGGIYAFKGAIFMHLRRLLLPFFKQEYHSMIIIGSFQAYFSLILSHLMVLL